MIAIIKSQVIKRVPYVGPVVQGVALALDAKEIVENSTPLGAAKIIGGRFLDSCLPPQIFIAGKCLFFVGGVITSIHTGGHPMVVSGTISAARSIIKNI